MVVVKHCVLGGQVIHAMNPPRKSYTPAQKAPAGGGRRNEILELRSMVRVHSTSYFDQLILR